MQIETTKTIWMNDTEYPLASNLRVAYKVQGEYNHKPYTEVFAAVGDMPVEQQLKIIYIAFAIANPEAATSVPFKDFLDYWLDNYNLQDLMSALMGVIQGVMGDKLVNTALEAAEEAEADLPNA